MNTTGLMSDSISGALSSGVVGVENMALNTSHLQAQQ